jgi:hypothetical protein
VHGAARLPRRQALQPPLCHSCSNSSNSQCPLLLEQLLLLKLLVQAAWKPLLELPPRCPLFLTLTHQRQRQRLLRYGYRCTGRYEITWSAGCGYACVVSHGTVFCWFCSFGSMWVRCVFEQLLIECGASLRACVRACVCACWLDGWLLYHHPGFSQMTNRTDAVISRYTRTIQ